MPNLNLTHSGNMNITSASITSGGTLNVGYQANDTGYITGWTITPASGDTNYETGQTISVKFYPQYSGTVLSETFVVSGVDNAGVNRSDSSVITQDYNKDLSAYFSGVVGDWYSLSTESADLISTSITSSYLEFVIQVKETATPGAALYLSISTNGSSKYTGATWLGWVKSQEPEPSSLTAITINVPSAVINSGYASASYSPSSTFVDLVYSSSDTTKATIDPTTGEITVLDSGTVQFCVTDQISGLYDCKTVSVSTSNPRVSVTYDIITTSQPEFMMNPDAISGFTYAEYNGEEVQMGKYYTFPETGLQTIVYTLAGTVVPDEAFVYKNTQIGDHYDVVGVSFENNTTEIGRKAFEYNRIASLVIPSSVTSVRQSAFNQNPITSLTLNEGLLVIEDIAFSSSDITTVNIPSTVTGTGVYDVGNGNPFWGCQSLSSFTGTFASDDGRLLVNNGYAISFAPSGLTTYNIPSGITRVGRIFSYSNLVSVTIPSSVTRIDGQAFLGCDDLTGITIPSSVTYIGAAAFGLCSGLTSMTFESEVPATLAGESVIPPENLGPYDYTFPIYVPETAVNTYKTAWPEYAHRIVAAHTPGDQYLTFKITRPGYIAWVDRFGGANKTIDYRKNGDSWTTITSSNPSVNISVVSGDTLEFRGINDRYYEEGISHDEGAYFASYNWCTFEVEGNIMSMLFGDEFPSADDMYVSAFTGLFSGCTGVTSAENLVLPRMHLSISCYAYMFAGCTYLTTPPDLPATGMNDYSYYAMFSGCTNLNTAPALPATTVYEGTYAYMFAGTNITTAPDLPATMFRSSYCYQGMFQNCYRLNYVKCLAKQILQGGNFTKNWLSNVSSSGTFVKNPEAPSNFWSSGASGIPSNWTVQDAS